MRRGWVPITLFLFFASVLAAASGVLSWDVGLLLGALLPAVAWVAYVRGWDWKEPEPPGAIFAGFLLGLGAAGLAVLLEAALPSPGGLFEAVVAGPLVEEAVKPMALYAYWSRRELDDELDAVFYAITSGMGFAFVENLVYEFAAAQEAGVEAWAVVALLRGINSTTAHACFTALVGYGLALARFRGRPRAAALSYLGASALHGVSNLLLSLPGPAEALALAILVVEPLAYALGVRALVSSAASLSVARLPPPPGPAASIDSI